MEKNDQAPGFWRICTTDAYLFKLCCVFLPALILLIVFTAASGRQVEDLRIPAILSMLLLVIIYYRWSFIKSIFNQHSSHDCSIGEISPGGGLLGLQVYVSFICALDGKTALRGCFLNRFSPRTKRLRKESPITVFFNEKNNGFIIKEAYLD